MWTEEDVGDLGIDGIIILKFTLEKYGVNWIYLI